MCVLAGVALILTVCLLEEYSLSREIETDQGFIGTSVGEAEAPGFEGSGHDIALQSNVQMRGAAKEDHSPVDNA